MNSNITVSVILPVYNVEAWIGECIESLKRQKQEGLEFIFVDDCSTDNSLSIVEAFAKDDSRVRVLRNKENSGPGPSRNAGIEAARGEYLSFIDPDDLISDDFFEQLYKKAKETGCDIIKGREIIFEDKQEAEDHSSGEKISALNKRILNGIRNNEPLFMLFSYEHQTAIYKKTLFSDKSVRYGTSRNDQDTTFLLRICLKAESICTTEEPKYYYRHREFAATNKRTALRIMNELESIREASESFKERHTEEESSEYFSRRWRGLITDYYYTVSENDMSPELRDEYDGKIKAAIKEISEITNWHGDIAELDVFMKHGYVIPCQKRSSDKFFNAGVKAWTDFLTVADKDVTVEYYHSYAEAIQYSFKSCRLMPVRAKLKTILLYYSEISRLDSETQGVIYKDLSTMITRAAKKGIRRQTYNNRIKFMIKRLKNVING